MCDRGKTNSFRSFTTCVSVLAAALTACAEAALLPVVPLMPLPVPDCIPMVERLQHLDQPSALGFSAVELLARVTGETQSPLVWLPPEQNAEYQLAYGPESGRSQLSVRITPVQGEIRYRYEQLSDTAPEGTVCADGVLEVPVSVSLRSQTQALDETFAARLEAKSAYRAELTHRFAPGTWSGGFAFTEVTSLDPQRVVSTGPLSLSLVLWEGGSQGSLGTEVVMQPKPSSKGGSGLGGTATTSGAAGADVSRRHGEDPARTVLPGLRRKRRAREREASAPSVARRVLHGSARGHCGRVQGLLR